MARFLAARLLHTILILFGVSLVAFGLIHLIPGNPLDILLPPEAPKSVVDHLRAEFGFDKPLYVQYLSWLGRVFRGNLGTSVFTGREVTRELLRALGNTLVIAVPAALLAFGLGTTLGALAAFNYGKVADKLISVIVILGLSVPHYWLGIVLVIVFAVQWNILPAAGMGGSGGIPTNWHDLSYLVLPVATLSMIPMGVIGRMVRSTVLEILSNDFPTALRAKGLAAAARGVSRAEECSTADGGGDGIAAWLSARRLDPGRNRLQLAGLRAVHEPGNLSPRYPGIAGNRAGAGELFRADQSARSTSCKR